MYGRTLYLNNTGSRWIAVDENYKRDMPFLLIDEDGNRKVRKADFYEQFGNFAAYHFRIKGIRYAGLPETFRDEETGLAVISHYHKIGKGE